MKILTILSSLLLSSSLMAEHDNKQANQGFLNAAKEYDFKAERATQNGNSHNAAIFKKLATIKRTAAVSTNGYDWAEYHKLSGQLKRKAPHDKKKKPYNFEDAAQRYDQLSKKALVAGDSEKSATYARLAEIKREALKSGGNYDWSEYKELSSKLGKEKKLNKDKPVAKKAEKKTPPQSIPSNYIESAQKHAALANESSAAKDNYSAQIHTRLAAILIDAAEKQSEDRDVDWTEYKELKELLGK